MSVSIFFGNSVLEFVYTGKPVHACFHIHVYMCTLLCSYAVIAGILASWLTQSIFSNLAFHCIIDFVCPVGVV